MPRFNCISISGYHMQEAGATADIELGYTLADGLEYIRTGLRAGLDIDAFAPRLSFFWAIGMNHFMEIAKLRAARVLWARLIKGFHPKNEKSMALRTHSQTSGWSLTAQDAFNNVVAHVRRGAGRGARAHAVAAHQRAGRGHRAARRTSRPASRATRRSTSRRRPASRSVVDPWAGSYYVERLTHELMHRAWHHIQEVEALGGMAKAIETGLPKMRIEEAAARRQARIDSGRETIVGVNRYRLEQEPPLPRARGRQPRGAREPVAAAGGDPRVPRPGRGRRARSRALTKAAEAGEGNLLALAVDAARARATLGEISNALETVFGRYQAVGRTISGVYSSESQQDPGVPARAPHGRRVRGAEGRRPRILVAKMGQDGHDRGAKVIATAFADEGFDVDVGPLFQTPREAAVHGRGERRPRARACRAWPAGTRRSSPKSSPS